MARRNACAALCMVARREDDVAKTGVLTGDVAGPTAPQIRARQSHAKIGGAAEPGTPARFCRLPRLHVRRAQDLT